MNPIARAVFTSSLLKKIDDSPNHKIPRDDATLFPKTLDRTLNVCTRSNIKACKVFAVKWILPSASRTAAFTYYLCLLSKACKPSDVSISLASRPTEELEGLQGLVNGRAQLPPDPIFRRLHALYLVHDILAFATLKLGKDSNHTHSSKVDSIAIQHLQNAIPTLARLAVCTNARSSQAAQEAFDVVQQILGRWEKHNLLPTNVTSELHAKLEEARNKTFSELLSNLADEDAEAVLDAQRAQAESIKWIVPRTHSLPNDPAAPWHELPAANGLFQRRTQGYPLRAAALPQAGYSLQNAGSNADEDMKKDVESLLTEAKRSFDKYTDASEVEDIDALGNIIWKANTGRKRRNHWGWSYESVEEKKRFMEE